MHYLPARYQINPNLEWTRTYKRALANFPFVLLQNEQESALNKTPVGFRCNFCIEVHPTLRAICNHLRKHVQYGEVKEGHVKVNKMLFSQSPEPR